MTYAEEAIGVARAAKAADVPIVVSFTTETDGKLPCGEDLGDAVRAVDDATDGFPSFYMVNCAHPTHFGGVLRSGEEWTADASLVRRQATEIVEYFEDSGYFGTTVSIDVDRISEYVVDVIVDVERWMVDEQNRRPVAAPA